MAERFLIIPLLPSLKVTVEEGDSEAEHHSTLDHCYTESSGSTTLTLIIIRDPAGFHIVWVLPALKPLVKSFYSTFYLSYRKGYPSPHHYNVS
jgi:hypothetical protein